MGAKVYQSSQYGVPDVCPECGCKKFVEMRCAECHRQPNDDDLQSFLSLAAGLNRRTTGGGRRMVKKKCPA